MRIKGKSKHILIVGIISLVVTGIILSSNWTYFIQNNDNNNTSLSSYQISTNDNIYAGYNQEESSIIFQINVLKSAINRNNIMDLQYNNIFKHNITYKHLQESNIQNKIKIANSSINHEISMLNRMKNIIHSHPYNYLKFFQEKNYTLPQIVSQNTINYPVSISNIKTDSQSINQSNVTMKNISYQSEEAAIGIGAISLIVKSSKTLIFSKVHFNFNNIYYFSKSLNNLSTINKDRNVINSQNTNKEDQFLGNNHTNHGRSPESKGIYGLIDMYKFFSGFNKNIVPIATVSGLFLTLILGGMIYGSISVSYRETPSNEEERVQPTEVTDSNEEERVQPTEVTDSIIQNNDADFGYGDGADTEWANESEMEGITQEQNDLDIVHAHVRSRFNYRPEFKGITEEEEVFHKSAGIPKKKLKIKRRAGKFITRNDDRKIVKRKVINNTAQNSRTTNTESVKPSWQKPAEIRKRTYKKKSDRARASNSQQAQSNSILEDKNYNEAAFNQTSRWKNVRKKRIGNRNPNREEIIMVNTKTKKAFSEPDTVVKSKPRNKLNVEGLSESLDIAPESSEVVFGSKLTSPSLVIANQSSLLEDSVYNANKLLHLEGIL